MDAGENLAFVPSQQLHWLPVINLKQPPVHYNVVDEAQSPIDMPWKTSVEPSQGLTFMPFWSYQMDFMKQLPSLHAIPVTNKKGTADFSYATSNKQDKDVRVANLAFASDEFRKIRMTYYDAGSQAQVFNSLWYPDPKYNLPVLGIDLLQFHGGKKHLVVIDFQPLEERSADKYEHLLKPIRDEYPSLQGKMSSRFYDESQFFSTQMLFGRLEDEEDSMLEQMWPAFQQCLSTYLELIQSTEPDTEGQDHVMQRQQAYDVYSANRDPALHLFKAKFGEKWADEYVHEFLFDLSR